jgi:hydroxymethylpyrimidine pyrophosphatase-like HAD family hydrolase
VAYFLSTLQAGAAWVTIKWHIGKGSKIAQTPVVDVIFNDIDGCFVPPHYDPLGDVQTDNISEPYFEYYRVYSGPQLVLCTGRAWINTVGILRRSGYLRRQRQVWPDQAVLCEHGMHVITDPLTGEGVSLMDNLPAFQHLRPATEHIKQAGRKLELALEDMRQTLEGVSGRKVDRIQLLQKKFSVAVRIPCFEGSTEQVDASLLRRSLTQVVREPLGSLLEEGTVQIRQSSSAIDITPPIGKGDGVAYLLQEYGTPRTRAAYIGDSGPDLDGMQRVDWVYCPANASPDVQAYVASLGPKGYVSPLAFADGERDILEHLHAVQAG